MKKLIAAAIIVLAGVVSTAPASADPPWTKGRSRQWRGRRQYWNPNRGWFYDNPLPGFLGGILGGWLGSQVNNDRGYDDERPSRESR